MESGQSTGVGGGGGARSNCQWLTRQYCGRKWTGGLGTHGGVTDRWQSFREDGWEICDLSNCMHQETLDFIELIKVKMCCWGTEGQHKPWARRWSLCPCGQRAVLCVCAHHSACGRACVRACGRACACAPVCVCVCARARRQSIAICINCEFQQHSPSRTSAANHRFAFRLAQATGPAWTTPTTNTPALRPIPRCKKPHANRAEQLGPRVFACASIAPSPYRPILSGRPSASPAPTLPHSDPEPGLRDFRRLPVGDVGVVSASKTSKESKNSTYLTVHWAPRQP